MAADNTISTNAVMISTPEDMIKKPGAPFDPVAVTHCILDRSEGLVGVLMRVAGGDQNGDEVHQVLSQLYSNIVQLNKINDAVYQELNFRGFYREEAE